MQTPLDNITLVRDFKNNFEMAKSNDNIDELSITVIKKLDGDLPAIALFAMTILHDIISDCPVKELRQYMRNEVIDCIYCGCHDDDDIKN